MNSDINALIGLGLMMEANNEEEKAIAYFRQLVAQFPDHPRVHFELAGAYDMAGYEAEAIPHYQQAIALGLEGEYRLRVAVQLGSSLRNVGRHTEAVATLKTAVEQYPDHVALRAFYALALTSAGDSKQGVAELLDVMLRHPTNLEAYHTSLRYYADELRGVKSDE